MDCRLFKEACNAMLTSAGDDSRIYQVLNEWRDLYKDLGDHPKTRGLASVIYQRFENLNCIDAKIQKERELHNKFWNKGK